MRHYHLVLACGLALLAPQLPALAQIQAEVQAGGLRYTLTELAPNDGKSPGLRLYDPGAAYISVSAEAPGKPASYRQGQSLDSLSLSAGWPGDSRVQGFYRNGGSLENSAIGLSFATLRPDLDGTILQARVDGPLMSVDLAPHTAVTLSLDVTLAMSMTPDAGGHTRIGSATASLLLWPDVNVEYKDAAEVHVGNQVIFGDDRLEDSAARTLSVNWANDSDATAFALLGYGVFGSAQAWTVSAVPEPAEWAMLATGLGLGLTRIKKRRSRRRGNGVRRWQPTA